VKKINLNQPILNLEGIAMKKEGDKDLLMKEIVANTMCIAKAKKNDEVVRQLNVAMEIYKSTGEIELEDADARMAKEVLLAADLSTLVLGQIIKVFDAADKAPEKK
jgi:hypothetical protein